MNVARGWQVATQPTRHIRAFAELEQAPYGVLPLPRVRRADRDWPLRPAPRTGEHTREVLRELGLSEAEIETLAAHG